MDEKAHKFDRHIEKFARKKLQNTEFITRIEALNADIGFVCFVVDRLRSDVINKQKIIDIFSEGTDKMAALIKQHQGLLKMERTAKDACYQTAILENRRLTKIINHLIVKARALRKKGA